ncbi:MAG: UDP-N-acetylglucosamine--N-acetylmuramyl-(pentapeptide) pyrophosphoryl-undecaprenol N-acetylglucosamine transferase [Clostridia bacterium]|nr:UDP-N-acetylglucosamine--N-acetylmuramyl-(pentapeptide) pyrophosphoryl-undecaprenol N-acetylglucosamine transferase [Clostridia bacterium]
MVQLSLLHIGLKIPTMLHESNAFPGRAVKFLLKKTDVVMCSFEEAKPRLAKAKRVVMTGTPSKTLKKPLTLAEKITVKEKYKLNPAKPVVLAFGGSQGAKAINDAVVNLVVKKLNRNYQILLACGQKQYDNVKEDLRQKGFNIEKLDGIKMVPYIYELQEAMSACEIICARSGAGTITEIANLRKAFNFDTTSKCFA